MGGCPSEWAAFFRAVRRGGEHSRGKGVWLGRGKRGPGSCVKTMGLRREAEQLRRAFDAAAARGKEQESLVAELTDVVAAQKSRLKAAASSSAEAAGREEAKYREQLNYLKSEARTGAFCPHSAFTFASGAAVGTGREKGAVNGP